MFMLGFSPHELVDVDDQIFLPPTTSRIRITWELQDVPDMSYEAFVKSYRDSYQNRYASYLASGGKPWKPGAIEVLSREERKKLWR